MARCLDVFDIVFYCHKTYKTLQTSYLHHQPHKTSSSEIPTLYCPCTTPSPLGDRHSKSPERGTSVHRGDLFSKLETLRRETAEAVLRPPSFTILHLPFPPSRLSERRSEKCLEKLETRRYLNLATPKKKVGGIPLEKLKREPMTKTLQVFFQTLPGKKRSLGLFAGTGRIIEPPLPQPKKLS